MFCKNCGSELEEITAFCPHCGLKLEPEQVEKNAPTRAEDEVCRPDYEPPAPDTDKKRGSALGWALGLCWFPLVGFILSVCAFPTVKAAPSPARLTSVAIALVVSAVVTCFAVLFILSFFNVEIFQWA